MERTIHPKNCHAKIVIKKEDIPPETWKHIKEQLQNSKTEWVEIDQTELAKYVFGR